MLNFPKIGGDAEDAGQEPGLDRSSLRAAYEAALRAQSEHRHAESAAEFQQLLSELARQRESSSAARDEGWFRRFRMLCFRNLADSQRALGEPAQAMQSLWSALDIASGEGHGRNHPGKDAPLWLAVASCALDFEDWPAAQEALQVCLHYWPSEPGLLRNMARCSLHLGDLRSCHEVMELLAETHDGMEARETWLLQRLRRRWEEPWPKHAAAEAATLLKMPEEEADYAALSLARVKRRRCLPGVLPETEEQRLGRLSIIELLQAMRLLVDRAVPPAKPVIFILHVPEPSILEAPGGQVDQLRAEEASSEAAQGMALTQSLLEALRSLVAEPWPNNRSPKSWLAQSLFCPSSFSGKEAKAVSQFLGMDGELNVERPPSSQALSLRSWLFKTINFTAERWQEVLQGSDLFQVTQLQVELLSAAALLSYPSQDSDKTGLSLLTLRWATNKKFLSWVAGPDEPDEGPEAPRILLRGFVQKHGLGLADACAAVRARANMDDAGRNLLKAWLAWHELLGLQLSGMQHEGLQSMNVRIWLEDALRVGGTPQDMDSQTIAAELVQAAPGSIADCLFYLWVAGSLAQDKRTKEKALLRFQALARVSGIEATASIISGHITSAQVDVSLQELRGTPKAPSSEGDKGVEELAQQVASGNLALDSEKTSDKASINRFLDLLCSLFGNKAPDMSAKLNAVVLEALAKLLCQFTRSVSGLDASQWKSSCAETLHYDLAPRILKFAALLLETMALQVGAMESAEVLCAPSPLLLGVQSTAGSTGNGVFLSVALEQLAVGSLLLVAELSEHIFDGSAPWEWVPIAQGALVLGLKATGFLLRATCDPSAAEGHGLLIVRNGKPAIASRNLWQRMCTLLSVGHDVGLFLPEFYLSTRSDESSAQSRVQEAAATLSGSSRIQHRALSTDKDSALCLPRVLLTCALRVDCSSLAPWRSSLKAWTEKVAARSELSELWREALCSIRQDLIVPRLLPTAGEVANKDDVEATLKLLARGIACLWPVRIDPQPPRSMVSRSILACKMLSENLVFQISHQDLQGGLEDAAQRHFASHVDSRQVPLMALATAMAVHEQLAGSCDIDELGGAEASSGAQTNFLRDAMELLDAQLFFSASAKSSRIQVPLTLFHPLVFPRFVESTMEKEVQLPPYFARLRQLRGQDAGSVMEPSDFSSRFFHDSHADAKSRRTAFEELAVKLDEMSRREVEPSRRRSGKVSSTSRDDDIGANVEQLEKQDLEMALELSKKAFAIPPLMALPPPLGTFYDLLLALAPRDSQKVIHRDVFQVLTIAVKVAAFSPSNWRVWLRVANAFTRLFLLEDDKRFQFPRGDPEAFANPKSAPWDAAQRCVYSHARVLNLMLWSTLERDISKKLDALASHTSAENEKAVMDSVRDMAAHWLERQLHVLVLFRCRKRNPPEGRNDAKQILLLQRCELIAKRLLWFLLRCTDYDVLLAHQPKAEGLRSIFILEKEEEAWPRPKFADAWLKVSAVRGQFLLHVGQTRHPPAYLWYIPYILGRVQWKLLTLQKKAPADEAMLDVVNLLIDASILDTCVNAHIKSNDSGKRRRVLHSEPHYRQYSTRLRMCWKIPGGWQVAAKVPYHEDVPQSKGETEKDSLEGLKKILDLGALNVEQIVQVGLKLPLLRATQRLADGRLDDAVAAFGDVVESFSRSSRIGASGPYPELGMDPWKMHDQRLRKIYSAKQKAIGLCLKLFKDCVAKATAKAASPMSVALGPLLLCQDKNHCPTAVQPEHRLAVCHALKELSDDRPTNWKALTKMTVHIAKLAWLLAEHEKFEFWEAAGETLVKELRNGFERLLSLWSRGASHRPCMDWELYAALRYACVCFREYLPAKKDEKKDQDPISKLQQCLAGAAFQLEDWARHTSGKGRSGQGNSSTQSPHWFALSEAFFQSVRNDMPAVGGLETVAKNIERPSHDAMQSSRGNMQAVKKEPPDGKVKMEMGIVIVEDA